MGTTLGNLVRATVALHQALRYPAQGLRMSCPNFLLSQNVRPRLQSRTYPYAPPHLPISLGMRPVLEDSLGGLYSSLML